VTRGLARGATLIGAGDTVLGTHRPTQRVRARSLNRRSAAAAKFWNPTTCSATSPNKLSTPSTSLSSAPRTRRRPRSDHIATTSADRRLTSRQGALVARQRLRRTVGLLRPHCDYITMISPTIMAAPAALPPTAPHLPSHVRPGQTDERAASPSQQTPPFRPSGRQCLSSVPPAGLEPAT
jgi:hypothetical protein